MHNGSFRGPAMCFHISYSHTSSIAVCNAIVSSLSPAWALIYANKPDLIVQAAKLWSNNHTTGKCAPFSMLSYPWLCVYVHGRSEWISLSLFSLRLLMSRPDSRRCICFHATGFEDHIVLFMMLALDASECGCEKRLSDWNVFHSSRAALALGDVAVVAVAKLLLLAGLLPLFSCCFRVNLA